MRKGNLISAIIFIIIGIYVLIEVSTFPNLGGEQVTGPEFFPKILAIVLIVLSLILFISTILDKENRETGLFNALATKTYITMFSLLAYVLLMGILGFIIPTIVFLIGMIRLCGMKSIPRIAIVSILATFVIYGVFQLLLAVPLPTISFLN
ncbi:MAG: hypothetical protein K0R15_1502 [Clostridiales bacterium]|nr:hypothetical protein [Clostridiales bacterium]